MLRSISKKVPLASALFRSTPPSAIPQLSHYHTNGLRSFSAMKDEYGAMTATGDRFSSPDFELEFGGVLPRLDVVYRTYGQLNSRRDNVLVVCHALTGNASIESWWGDLLGAGRPFDPSRYFIICANILGSCYGSSSPISVNPKTNHAYGSQFPPVSVRDTVRAHKLVLDSLGIDWVHCVVGGSLGGMQALEWMLLFPDLVEKSIVLACGAYHTSWQIGISECQRQAIFRDPKWKSADYGSDAPLDGLSIARQIAMISYRSPQAYFQKFPRERVNNRWSVENYLDHQGTKFLSRFDASCYVSITQMMDTHDVGRDRNGHENALRSIRQPVLLMGVDSDYLYPTYEQKEMAALIPNCKYREISSVDGHDGFLLEQEQVSRNMMEFL